jgi:hypothetical protein
MVEAGAMAVVAGVMDTATTADAALLAARLAGTAAAADFMATPAASTEAAASTAEAAASMVAAEVDSTVVGVADTGNRILVSGSTTSCGRA